MDIENIVNNVNNIYNSNDAFAVLKDFERVLDDLDLYVFDNWINGELVKGPDIEKYWVTCQFMWPRKNKPDPLGRRRLETYGCEVKYIKDYILEPRKIKTPDDLRPGSKKGKLDKKHVWVVQIKMPKSLIKNVYHGFLTKHDLIKTNDEENFVQDAEQKANETPPINQGNM